MSALCLSEDTSESSLEIESMIVKIEGISESTYLSTNNLNFALFSVYCPMQANQGKVKVFMTCAIPNPIGVMIFRGVAYFYHQFVAQYTISANQSHALEGSYLFLFIKFIFVLLFYIH